MRGDKSCNKYRKARRVALKIGRVRRVALKIGGVKGEGSGIIGERRARG